MHNQRKLTIGIIAAIVVVTPIALSYALSKTMVNQELSAPPPIAASLKPPSLPEGFTTNLTSPPMWVEAWNAYDEPDEMMMDGLIMTYGAKGANASGDYRLFKFGTDFDPELGFISYDWKGVAIAVSEVGGEADYAGVTVEAHMNTKAYRNTTVLWTPLPVLSFYIPPSAEEIMAVRVSFDYALIAKISWSIVNTNNAHIYCEARASPGFFLYREYENGSAEVLAIMADYVEVRNETIILGNEKLCLTFEAEDKKGKQHYSLVVTSEDALFIRDGDVWVTAGVLFYVDAEIYYAQAFRARAEARAVAYMEDVEIRAIYRKRAFQADETGFVLYNNHTAWIKPRSPATHLINYSVRYSETWDAFTFAIDVPDYERSLTFPTYETYHLDGLLLGSCSCTSPNYVESLRAYVKSLRSLEMFVLLNTRSWGSGEAELFLYGPDWGHVVARLEMNRAGNTSTFWKEVTIPIECPTIVRVVDEDGEPIASAYVEVYDYHADSIVATGYTDENGVLELVLPHQGYYRFYAYAGSSMGSRLHSILPLMAVTYEGPFPAMPSYGRLEIGMKRTGSPASPPYNTVFIELKTEATLIVDAIAVLPPFPYRLERTSVSIHVYDENDVLVASGQTPFVCHLPTGIYHLTAQETTVVNGTELHLVAWVLVDSPPTEANATINLWSDRYVYAIYGQGSLLEILSMVSDMEFGDALIMLVNSSIQDVYDLPRLWPSATSTMENGSFTSMIFPSPRAIWTGSTPALACLPESEYTMIAIAYAPNGYEVIGWDGVDEELGTFYAPLMDTYVSIATLSLTNDTHVYCIHELKEGADPLLIVRAKLPDGTELPGVVIDVQGIDYHELSKTPYRRRLSGTYVIEAEGYLGADIVLVGWEGADLYNGTRALVNVGEGRLVWAIYEHASNQPRATHPGLVWPDERGQVLQGPCLSDAPRTDRLKR